MVVKAHAHIVYAN